jgi:Holliday junction resolvase
MAKESQIQKKILDFLIINDFYVIKTVMATRNGVPDIISCKNGKFVAFEVKNEKGRVSKLQEYNIGKIKAAGGEAFVVRSLDEVRIICSVLFAV